MYIQKMELGGQGERDSLEFRGHWVTIGRQWVTIGRQWVTVPTVCMALVKVQGASTFLGEGGKGPFPPPNAALFHISHWTQIFSKSQVNTNVGYRKKVQVTKKACFLYLWSSERTCSYQHVVGYEVLEALTAFWGNLSGWQGPFSQGLFTAEVVASAFVQLTILCRIGAHQTISCYNSHRHFTKYKIVITTTNSTWSSQLSSIKTTRANCFTDGSLFMGLVILSISSPEPAPSLFKNYYRTSWCK